MQEIITIDNVTCENILDNYHLINEYKLKMKSYSQYCKEEEKENWNKAIDYLLHIIAFEPVFFELEMKNFEEVGCIMEMLAKGYTYKEIKNKIHKKRYTYINKLLHKYSKYRINYIKIRYYEKYQFEENNKFKKVKKMIKKSNQ